MTAVARPLDDLRDVLEAHGDAVVVANHNGPAQCVLSGATDAIARVEHALEAKGMTTRRLAVATAFHSPLVAASSAPFRSYLSELEIVAPAIDVYGTADGVVYPRDPRAVRERLAAQIVKPVRFVDQIEALYARGIRTFIEVGPGRVLTELVGRILNDRTHRAVHLDRHGSHGLTSLQDALGRLAVAGVGMDLGVLWNAYAPPSDKPAKKPAMTIPVSGVNCGKPYPPAGGARDLPAPNPPRETTVETPRAVAATPSNEIHFAWVQAYQEAQRQTADAHAAYQRAMAESHVAFLKTSEASFAGLSALLGGEHRAALPTSAAPDRVAAPPPPLMIAPPIVPAVSDTVLAPSDVPAPLPPPQLPAADAGDIDLEAFLIAVVSEKTGYPAHMLNADMELEADLGVDSIKRVEILSAMRDRAPGLREVKSTELAELRTLGQIVAHLRADSGAGRPESAHAPVHAVAEPAVSLEGSATEGRSADRARPEIHRFALREVPSPAVGIAMPGILAVERVVITDDGVGLASVLAGALATRGVPASVVSEVPPGSKAIIFLGGMRRVADVDDAIAVNREAFHAARATARLASEAGGVFVTVQDTGGDFGLRGGDPTRAWLGGVSALARTAALEWPRASVKAIDCERGGRDLHDVAGAICAELFEGGATLEVGLRADGARTTPARVAASVHATASSRVGPESVVVASGGARGITAAGLIALARTSRARMCLLGRTPITAEPAALRGIEDDAGLRRALVANGEAEGLLVVPTGIAARAARVLANREIRATLDALAAAGSPARYFDVDVQDAAAVAAALDIVRREWGPITAIVHGAGVLADRGIADKTDAQFDRVFDTKVAGLRALIAATSADPLTAVCLFSSVAARTGNPGQCDYAMANEVLNLVACAEQARRGNACMVRSIGWGPWAGGMVTPGLRTHFEERGVPLIPIDVGAKIFADEVGSAGDDVVVVVGGETDDGLLGIHAPAALSVDVGVEGRPHPYVDDHRIAGAAVVGS
jgi:hypothetical protein